MLQGAIADINSVSSQKYVADPPTKEQVREYSITEQELRDSCGFFRSGESTARATLNVLRFMKKIKQVHVVKEEGGMGVAYILLG